MKLSKNNKVRDYVNCPDCSTRILEGSLKNHKGNKTCSAVKHSQIMLSKGYERIFWYAATLRRLGVEVISETDAKTCVHVGNKANTYYCGWVDARMAKVARLVKYLSPFLRPRNRNILLKRALTGDTTLTALQIVDKKRGNNYYKSDWIDQEVPRLLGVPIDKSVWQGYSYGRRARHVVTIHPDGRREPCCKDKFPQGVDLTSLEVVNALGMNVPPCIIAMAQHE